MESEKDDHRNGPHVFSPFTREGVEEFIKGNSHPAEPEETPPPNLRRRLAWLRERRDRKSRGASPRQQQNYGADWRGADQEN
jgi:hypothetical protein